MDMLDLAVFMIIWAGGFALIRVLGMMRYARRTGLSFWEGLVSAWASERAWRLSFGAWAAVWIASCFLGFILTAIILQ